MPAILQEHAQQPFLSFSPSYLAESHTLRTSNKPPDALHTEAVVAAVKAARRAILLTGTPSLSRPFDLFRQVGVTGCTCCCALQAHGRLACTMCSQHAPRASMPGVSGHVPIDLLLRWTR